MAAAEEELQRNAEAVDGNELVAMCLARAGIDKMFGVVGIPVTSLANRAVASGVRFIAFHNEQSAGYAASAYGYLTRTPGILLTVSGPGCVHGLAGLSNAAANGWPMVMISGSCDQNYAGRGDFQELDQIAAVKPFSKFSTKATDISEIPNSVFSVVDWALRDRPGGTYLDLPSDVLHQTINQSEAERLISEALDSRIPNSIEKPRNSQIQKAVELLRKAERPLIVFGKGAAYSRAELELTKLIETIGIPFLPTPMAKGLLPDTHELAATAARSLAIGKCDVALVIGARLNWLLHFGDPPRWSNDVKFILVDISGDEIESRKPHLGIVGDARDVVGMIHEAVKDDPFCLGRRHPWVEAIRNKINDNVGRLELQLGRNVVPFNFLTPMRIIRDAISRVGTSCPAPVVVSEGANTMDVGRAVLVQSEPRTRLDAGTWGTMGVGLGYCIAAAVAVPDRLVVAVEGDSGFGFSAMEVETVVRYQLPVIVIVFNNGGVYGGDRRSPKEIIGPHSHDPAPTAFVPDAAYHLLIEAFGGKGYVCSTPEELQSALDQSFSARKPALVNVIVDPFAGAESGRLQHKN
ncbi:hypothetical protein M569_10823 [Genlisea aurea]|uniref:2-hydroxyacyl-CoA lyase n=1 Tax=Genlisea aurea TaxID=192259 RepID=S8CAT6_9LAMI|nr:hypothetical protein M569_10823 [Genlisea aurea]